MVLQNQLGIAPEHSTTGEFCFPGYFLPAPSTPLAVTRDLFVGWESDLLRHRRLAITLLAAIRHVVFDVHSSVRHKGALDDGADGI